MASFAERNYSGFDVKVTAETKPVYDSLLAELATTASAASTPAACNEVLGRWVAFFKDGHLSFTRRSATAAPAALSQSPEAIRAQFTDWERVELDEAGARARLVALAGGRAEVEGIWESLDARYRVAVLRDAREDRDYTMTILRADSIWWMPGQTKATLRRADGDTYAVRFYMQDHSERSWTGQVRRNVLMLDGGSPWIRLWPQEPSDIPRAELLASNNSSFAARELSPGTVLVQVPTFGDPRRIDSLFEAQGELIRNADRLIIDVRGNGGGSDYNFRHFMPLVYTRPITIVSVQALATPENVRAHELLAADTTYPLAQREQMRQTIEVLRTANGGWHVWEDRVHTEAEVLAKPRRVAIVTDRRCASSCEQFILASIQSSKVTLYGDRTAGILDYGNVRRAEMPGGTLVLHHPTTRSKRVPHAAIDNIGIQPQVRIPADEPSPLEWVIRHLDALETAAGAEP